MGAFCYLGFPVMSGRGMGTPKVVTCEMQDMDYYRPITGAAVVYFIGANPAQS